MRSANRTRDVQVSNKTGNPLIACSSKLGVSDLLHGWRFVSVKRYANYGGRVWEQVKGCPIGGSMGSTQVSAIDRYKGQAWEQRCPEIRIVCMKNRYADDNGCCSRRFCRSGLKEVCRRTCGGAIQWGFLESQPRRERQAFYVTTWLDIDSVRVLLLFFRHHLAEPGNVSGVSNLCSRQPMPIYIVRDRFDIVQMRSIVCGKRRGWSDCLFCVRDAKCVVRHGLLLWSRFGFPSTVIRRLLRLFTQHRFVLGVRGEETMRSHL